MAEAKRYVPEFRELDPKKHGLRHRSMGINEPALPMDSREAKTVQQALQEALTAKPPRNNVRTGCDPLPSGAELEALVLRRCREPISRDDLWRGIYDGYQTRGGSRKRVEQAIDRLIEECKLSETNGKLSLREQARLANAPIRKAIMEAVRAAPGISGKPLLARVREGFPDIAERRVIGILGGMAREGAIREAAIGGWEIAEDNEMVQSEDPRMPNIIGSMPDLPDVLPVSIPGSDLPPADWMVVCGESWTAADTEEDARRIAEGQAYPDEPAAIYRRVAICRLRTEWDDD